MSTHTSTRETAHLETAHQHSCVCRCLHLATPHAKIRRKKKTSPVAELKPPATYKTPSTERAAHIARAVCSAGSVVQTPALC